MNEDRAETLPAPVQGVDSIVVQRPASELWPLIAESKQLTNWGPPVVAVELLDPTEQVGSRRLVQASFGRKKGQFTERRILQREGEDGYAMAFVIEADTFGLDKMLANIGSLMELTPITAATTELKWSFFHEPRGILGRVMNRVVILRQQRANRRRALESFKAFAETGSSAQHRDQSTRRHRCQ
jgi:hypothetical protein